MFEILKNTVSSTFDLYKDRGKLFYSFSCYFTVLANIGLSIFALFYCNWLNDMMPLTNYIEGRGFLDIFSNPFILHSVTLFARSLMIISIGLYAAYLLQEKNKPDIKDFFNTINPPVWHCFYLIAGLFCLLHAITFKNIFAIENENEGMMQILNTFGAEGPKIKFFKLLNGLVTLIKTYLPYFGAALITLTAMGEKINTSTIKKYKKAFLSILFFSFIIEKVSEGLMRDVYPYLSDLFRIIFPDSMILFLFHAFIYLLIITYFILALAAAILYPLKCQKEKITVEDPGETTETDPKEIIS